MPARPSLAVQLAEAEERFRQAEATAAAAVRAAEEAERKVDAIAEELQRARASHRVSLIAVVVVALLAILMLGLVAFNAVD